MKTVLPWLLAIAGLAGAAFFYSTSKSKQSELQTLRPQVEELNQLRAENEDLKKVAAQTNELARLRKENEDVLKLRNEVRQLREEKKQIAGQLQTAQADLHSTKSFVQTVRPSEPQAPIAGAKPEEQELEDDFKLLKAKYLLATPEGQKKCCVAFLRQLDAAKQQWALENNKTEEAVPTAKDVSAYLKGADTADFLKCPAGGVYTIGAVNTDPTCSIPGHKLPQQ